MLSSTSMLELVNREAKLTNVAPADRHKTRSQRRGYSQITNASDQVSPPLLPGTLSPASTPPVNAVKTQPNGG